MSTALPSLARTGARILASGALAIGLLTSAPTPDAHAGTAHQAKHAKDQTKKGKGKHPRPHLGRVARAMNVAAAHKGAPYRYGAAGPRAFDCSGLTYFSFRRAGFPRMPRTSSGQAGFARHISRGAMRRGDLMFFRDGGGVYHVGLFVGWRHGRRLVLHAPYSGTRVRVDRVWTNSWFPGTLRHR